MFISQEPEQGNWFYAFMWVVRITIFIIPYNKYVT